MNSSRENSPDWLRCFQAPTHSTLVLSSDSDSGSNSLPNASPSRDDKISSQSPESENGAKSLYNQVSKLKAPKRGPEEDEILTEKKTRKKKKTARETQGDRDDVGVVDVDVLEKHTGPQVSMSRIPLLLSEKVNRSKVLVECEGESIDLSGDMGAVGRVVISDSSAGNHEMYLDLKGTIYRTKIVPSRTFCIVSFGQSEAKVEAIMNDFIQLKAQSNVYEAETMVEGTLEGFSFDSEDEADKMPKPISHGTDQNEGNEEQINAKTKGKVKKSSGVVQKKGKTGGKPQPTKRVRKKAQVPKKAKAKK